MRVFLILKLSEQHCTPGSNECKDGELKMCDINGDWIVVDCPLGTKCSTNKSKVGCVSTSNLSHEFLSEENEQKKEHSKAKEDEKPKISSSKIKTVYKSESENVKTKTVTIYSKLNDQKNIDKDKSEIIKTVTVTERTAPKEIKFEYTTPESISPISKTLVSESSGQSSKNNNNEKQANDQSNTQSQQIQSQNPGKQSQENEQSQNSPTNTNSKSQSDSDNNQNQSAPRNSLAQNDAINSPKQKEQSNSQKNESQSFSGNNNQSKPDSESTNPKNQNDQGIKNKASSNGKAQTDKNDSNASKESKSGSNISKENQNSSSGGNMITTELLSKCLKELNFPINEKFIKIIVDATNKNFKSKEMAAQFLAQTAHESGGFNHIQEIACENNKCPNQYGSNKGAPGKQYYGRGFIQLSWPENYKNASKDLFNNDSLYQNPEKVASDPKIGAEVSVWFWNKNVEGKQGVGPDHFGYSTKAINGELECKGNKNMDKSKKRYEIYKKIAKAMNLKKIADEKGCYTA